MLYMIQRKEIHYSPIVYLVVLTFHIRSAEVQCIYAESAHNNI